ncbi:tRNA (adenosine(37)-N6)-threonylcarbamoyltransferase complex ATPase subunit type 1 TsaE [Piscinibacter sakaiensis]|uniref:tRNA (adenosine(37)-N6)-threonylcarbamoyltransferase complex ATPase subunit type 1 TsaE n=1 Tax=Piscinibacter sakaiensis TaxID=1547922 RepID=UPI003AB0DD4E
MLAARPAIRSAFITLHGTLGAGKTSFARHLLRALGVDGPIKSPTYTMVEEYRLQAADGDGPTTAWHFDFYRFDDPHEWEDAGFRDIFAQRGLKLAEWPEKAAGLLPPDDLSITLVPGDDDARHVTIEAHSALGQELLR